jgi:hypothetical protein
MVIYAQFNLLRNDCWVSLVALCDAGPGQDPLYPTYCSGWQKPQAQGEAWVGFKVRKLGGESGIEINPSNGQGRIPTFG